jgi:protein SCO1/2
MTPAPLLSIADSIWAGLILVPIVAFGQKIDRNASQYGAEALPDAAQPLTGRGKSTKQPPFLTGPKKAQSTSFIRAVTEKAPPKSSLKQVRTLLWVLVALAVAGTAAAALLRSGPSHVPQATSSPAEAKFGGPFTLVGSDGKPFSSVALAGKPYAMFFGFTRCGDVCPTTLSRLVKLRREAADDAAMNIVFVTIDPERDGPKDVGQYATLFGAPIIGLTGSPAQIDQVKKQYGIYARPEHMTGHDYQMSHTSTVLLFGRDGRFGGTIAADDPDSSALDKLKHLVA